MGFDLGHSVSSLSKLVIRTNRKMKDANINKEESKTFSVNVFLGKDKMIRFIPGIKNNFDYKGLYNGETADDIAKRKGLRYREDILDNKGSDKLIANLFRISQTDQR